MKVCVTGLRGVPGIMGGIESHCEELLPLIKARHPDIQIEILARAPYVDKDPVPFHDMKVVPMPSSQRASLEALLGTFSSVLYARFRAKADLLHIHAIGPALLTPIAKLLGLKVVVTHHGKDYDRAKWGAAAKAMLRCGEWCGVVWADAVVAVSPSLTEDLRRRFVKHAGKIAYVPNGASELPEQLGDNEGDPLATFALQPMGYIIGVGRLVPEKGFHDLIDAFELAEGQRKLVIVGGADHASEYSRALTARGGGNIIFTGRLARSSLRRLLEGAALFVMPSYHEGLPIAALEAAVTQTPMLLSDIVPNQDIGLSANHYFRVGDTEQLAELLRQPASDFRIDAAEIRSRFDWPQVAAKTFAIYQAVYGPRVRARPVDAAVHSAHIPSTSSGSER